MGKRDRKNFEAYGDLYFVTSVVIDFLPIFTNEEVCDIFVDNLRFYQERGDYILLAWVLMPNHFHLVAKITGLQTISAVVGNLKRMTSRQIRSLRRDEIKASASSAPKKVWSAQEHEREVSLPKDRVWEHRFDCFVVTNEDALRQKIQYIHFNPVRKGFVENPTEWKWSSARDYEGASNSRVTVDHEWKCLGYLNTVPSGRGS
jgi:REP element-mobilizing transposase RayT